MEIKDVESEKIRKLRHSVLRKGKPFSTTKYNKDNQKDTFHLAVIEGEKTITCATFYPEKTKHSKSEQQYRLRGMATDLEFRRKGFGKLLMEESFERLKQKKCDTLWCNARLVAVDFYRSLGFETKGKMFNIRDIGPHYYMFKELF